MEYYIRNTNKNISLIFSNDFTIFLEINDKMFVLLAFPYMNIPYMNNCGKMTHFIIH